MLSDHPETLILFYNAMWGKPLEMAGLPMPDGYRLHGCVLTTDRQKFQSAAAVVFHAPEMASFRLPPKRKGQIWVAWSMECDLYCPWIQDPAFMAGFDLTMTYHLDSDVPVPYYDSGFVERLRKAPEAKYPSPIAVQFVSSPANLSRRFEMARALMEHVEVHSFGRLLQNRSLAEDHGIATKLDVIANYKFTLAFENAIAQDYVTEKFFDPLIAGSVPVYLGAPNVADFAPGEHCFINAADFESAKSLAEYLRALDQDETAYGRYLAWKHEPLRAQFVQKLEAVRESRMLALCRKVQELRRAQTVATFLQQKLAL